MNEATVFHLEVGAWQDRWRRSLWSVLKIATGSELRGRGGGSFGSPVGPHPLPLPARPFVRKCHRFREFRSGRVLEPSALTPLLLQKRRLWRPEKGKDWPAATEPREKVPEGRLSSSCCFSRAAAGLMRFSLTASRQAQGLGIPGAGCGRAS